MFTFHNLFQAAAGLCIMALVFSLWGEPAPGAYPDLYVGVFWTVLTVVFPVRRQRLQEEEMTRRTGPIVCPAQAGVYRLGIWLLLWVMCLPRTGGVYR